MIRVVLAEDQAIVRAGFRALLDAEPDICVAGEAATGDQALKQVQELRPDVVVMDIRMPGVDGLQATAAITQDKTLKDTKVLILTTFELDEYVFGALHAGASGFLLKGGEPADLLLAIRVVATGESLLAPSVTRRLIRAYTAQPQPPSAQPIAGLNELTTRELQILKLVAIGLNNSEIAQSLQLSPLTAKTHVSRILTKLGARDRVQLVVMAYQSHLIDN
jgi:DNA-binding NarL/FixJ family response regulator